MSTRNQYPILRVYERIKDYNTATATVPRAGKPEIRVICPVHAENSPSCDLDTNRNIWVCRSCAEGGDAIDMVIKSGTVIGARREQLYARAFAWLDEMMGTPHITPTRALPKPKIVTGRDGIKLQETRRTIFPYHDEHNHEAFQVLRIDGIAPDNTKDKTFRQRRKLPIGAWRRRSDGLYEYVTLTNEPVIYGPLDPVPIAEEFDREPTSKFLYTTRGLHLILFNLPAVRRVAAENGTLIYHEGEKKINTFMRRTHLPATKLPGGAKSPADDINLEYVHGIKKALIFTDADSVGREGARLRREFFAQAIPDILIVDIFGDNSKRDIEDWLDERPQLSIDDTRAALRTIVKNNSYR
jgi:hypothetical protein